MDGVGKLEGEKSVTASSNSTRMDDWYRLCGPKSSQVDTWEAGLVTPIRHLSICALCVYCTLENWLMVSLFQTILIVVRKNTNGGKNRRR